VPDATGNIPTEDLVYLLHECGVETGIDLDKAILAARLAEKIVGGRLPGQVMKARPRLRRYPLDAARTAEG
jgi:hydroxymethylglutaryl-CoA lyase